MSGPDIAATIIPGLVFPGIAAGLVAGFLFWWPEEEEYLYPLAFTGAMKRRNERIRWVRRARDLKQKAKECLRQATYWRERGEDMKADVLRAEFDAALREAERLRGDIEASEHAEREIRYRELTKEEGR